MLFTYTYVPHPLERLNGWLEGVVKGVWCNPQPHCQKELIEPEFRQVVIEIDQNARTHDYLWAPICRIHDICRDQLTPAQRVDLAQWFDANNDIEGLCLRKPGIAPMTYKAIARINAQLAQELEEFCTKLWSEVRNRKAVTERLGTLSEHFKEWRKVNRTGTCAFCGLARIEGIFSSIQEDYDHYLPKGIYVFNSAALKNLVPTCDKCNKKYKLQQDPLHKDGARRKAFYAYAAPGHIINVRITLSSVDGIPIDPENLCRENIRIELTAPGREEELEGWKEIYRIEERYAGVCCEGDTGGTYWLEQVLDEMIDPGKSQIEQLAKVIRAASASRWADANFLKIPFLEGCQRAGFIR